jgi:hypothetical protein
LQAVDDPRAKKVIDEAYHLLQDIAEKITVEDLCHSFLQKVNDHSFAASPSYGILSCMGIEPCWVCIGPAHLKEQTESEKRRAQHERILWFYRKPCR